MRRCPHICTPPLIALCALLLAACSTEPRVIAVRRYNGAPPPPQRSAERPGEYRVVAGDTLYSIAFRHQMDYRELARINGITAPYTIYPGQELRLHAAAGQYAPAASTRVVSRAPPRVATSTGTRVLRWLGPRAERFLARWVEWLGWGAIGALVLVGTWFGLT